MILDVCKIQINMPFAICLSSTSIGKVVTD